MAADIPKDRTVAALGEVWTSLDELLGSLDDEQWAAPSPLPGWDVRDNVAHIVGTERMLLGDDNPPAVDGDAFDHVRNDIGAFNEAWVASMRNVAPTQVLATFRDVTGRRRAALAALDQETWDGHSFTPAGRATYGRFMQIRVYDCWLHEQDIRDALGVPGHETGIAVDVTLDELATAMGFVVGKKAGASAGSSVTFALTDAGSVVRKINVEVAERAAVVETLSGPATVTLTMPVGVMTRLAAGRVPLADVRNQVAITGDETLGETILANLNYTL